MSLLFPFKGGKRPNNDKIPLYLLKFLMKKSLLYTLGVASLFICNLSADSTPASLNNGLLGPWVEKDGIVVIQPEHSSDLDSNWTVRPSTFLEDPTMAGSSGSGWVEWNGPQLFRLTINDNQANGISTLRFEIKTEGDYTFRWRSKQYTSVPSGDAGNDTYVKFETGTPLPARGSQGGTYTLNRFTKVWVQSRNVWSWSTNFEPAHGDFVFTPKIHYTPGIHEIKIAGRSRGHAIDRIILFHSSVNAGTAQSAPESERLIIEPDPNIWSENFDEVTVESSSGNNQTLSGTEVQTANSLSSVVVEAPAEFTSASGNSILLSTGPNSFAALRSSMDPINLTPFNIQAGSTYKLSFDIYIPTTLSHPIGAVQFRWNSSTNTSDFPTLRSGETLTAGVHHIEYTGTFPVDNGSGDFFPSEVRPFIFFHQNGSPNAEHVYLDNLNFEIAPPSPLTGFERFVEEHQLTLGILGDDDGDGVINLHEYAFGGDPKDSSNLGTLPEYKITGPNDDQTFEFIYNRLTDPDSGLVYRVELCDDLVSWDESGYTATSSPGATGMEIITNSVPTTKPAQFFRLVITPQVNTP